MRTPLNIKAWIRKFDLMTLRLFASITEEKNIGRAAAREAIAASAVTKRIHDLEGTLGFKLFYRDPKGAILTPAGEIVGRHVRRILGSVEDLHRELSEFAEGVQGHVRVWCTESALVEFFADDVGAFSRAFPLVSFDIQEGNSVDVLRAVSAGLADLGVCAEPSETPPRITGIDYRADSLVAVMTRAHSLSLRSAITFAEVLDSDLIGWSESSAVMRMLQRAAADLGREFKPKYRVASAEGARSLVRAGLGIAIQPVGMVWPFEDAERVCSVPLSDAWAQRKLAIYFATERTQSVAARTLIKHLTHATQSSPPALDSPQ